jgi:predicted Zn-dependent peptidase
VGSCSLASGEKAGQFSAMKRIILTTLIALSPLVAPAVDRTKQPTPGPAPAAAFPDFQVRTLGNGLRVVVIQDDRSPTITLRLQIKAGSTKDGGSGLSGFTARLLNRGTKKLDAGAFAEAIDSIGASLEGGASSDAMSVSTSGLTKFTDRLLELFADALVEPVFPADELAKEQRRALSGIAAGKKQPGTLASNLMGKVIFGDHPYGAFATEDSVKAITRDAIVDFHGTWVVPNNASLVIVGDVQPDAIVAKVEKAFAGWKKKDFPMIKQSGPPASLSGVTVHLVDRPESVQSNIVVCHTAPGRNFPDLPELNVVTSTLGGGFSGRLFQNLREKHGYTYGSSCAFNYFQHGGYFQATAEARNEVTVPAIKEILNEMGRIRTEAVPADELELQRQYNVGNYLLSLESAGRVAARVQDIELYGLPADFYKKYATRMSAVTPESAQKLAQKYISTENVAIVVVGKAEAIKADLEKIGKVVSYDADLKVVK